MYQKGNASCSQATYHTIYKAEWRLLTTKQILIGIFAAVLRVRDTQGAYKRMHASIISHTHTGMHTRM